MLSGFINLGMGLHSWSDFRKCVPSALDCEALIQSAESGLGGDIIIQKASMADGLHLESSAVGAIEGLLNSPLAQEISRPLAGAYGFRWACVGAT